MHDDAPDERATCAQKKINVAETGVWPTKGWFEREEENVNNAWYDTSTCLPLTAGPA